MYLRQMQIYYYEIAMCSKPGSQLVSYLSGWVVTQTFIPKMSESWWSYLLTFSIFLYLFKAFIFNFLYKVTSLSLMENYFLADCGNYFSSLY